VGNPSFIAQTAETQSGESFADLPIKPFRKKGLYFGADHEQPHE
jgi:hypothetical protein